MNIGRNRIKTQSVNNIYPLKYVRMLPEKGQLIKIVDKLIGK